MASTRQRYGVDATVTGNKTLTAADSGIIQNVTATATITLPTGAAGIVGAVYIIRVGSTGATDGAITVNVTPGGSDLVNGNGFTASAGKGAVATNQGGGLTEIVLQYGNTNNWFIVSATPGWTRQP